MTAPMHSASKSHQRFCCEDFDPRKKQLSLFNCEPDIQLSTSSSVFNDKHKVPKVTTFVLTSAPQLKQDSNCRIHTKVHTSLRTLCTMALAITFGHINISYISKMSYYGFFGYVCYCFYCHYCDYFSNGDCYCPLS